MPAADRAEFEAIATMCGIGLETRCYCQSYRDGMVRGEPGVQGVSADVLGVKVIETGKQTKRRSKKQDEGGVGQMKMEL